MRPSAETLLHCQIYDLFTDAGAVLHGGPGMETALARLEGLEFLLACELEKRKLPR